MRTRNLVAAAFLAWVAVRATADEGATARPASPPPKPTTLMERVEKRLVQLDVAVEGDPDAIRTITAKDFALYVGEREISGLIVDRLCGDEMPPATATTADHAAEVLQPSAPAPIPHSRATFIFYFDQPHLVMAGRAFSLETSRDLIQRLIVGGAQASIVSSARRLETIVPLTGDREKLLAGLDKLRTDFRQWDSYAMTEEGRAEMVAGSFTPCLTARGYLHEEWQEARQSIEKLGLTVDTLTEASVPKAIVYFGDTLRQKAGLHYLWLGCGPQSSEFMSAELVPSAAAEFDAVIKEALSRGVHFFTIQAEGIVSEGMPKFRRYREWDNSRHRQAGDALVALAAETGGEAFLGGASNKYIADKIESRTSCRLLLSFPPGDLPRDTPLAVTLELHVPKVKLKSQGRIVVPSPAAIERTRLLAAFVDSGSFDDGSLRALLIPRGGDGKSWKASVQLRLRPTGLPDNSAELGASIVHHDKVTDHFAASIATKSGSRAVVLEKTLDFSPGEVAVVAVARDAKRGDIGSTRLDAEWPSPAKVEAAIAPIAVLQTGPAAMAQDGAIGTSGLLARDVDEMLDPSASVSLETVVCRGAKIKAPIVVERWLEDGLENGFAPMTIAETDDPCIRTVDVVSAGRLRPGVVDYRVTARIGDAIVASERRSLRVAAAGDR